MVIDDNAIQWNNIICIFVIWGFNMCVLVDHFQIAHKNYYRFNRKTISILKFKLDANYCILYNRVYEIIPISFI